MTDLAEAKKAGAAIGRPVERVEDARLLKGQGKYIDDLRRDGMLFAAIVRSPVAHGRLRAVDTSAALKRAGVHAVITADDVKRAMNGVVPTIPLRSDAVSGIEPFQQPVIAHGKVRYVGEPVAVVVADSPAQAEDAVDAVVPDIEALPALADWRAAQKNDVRLFEAQESNCALVVSAVRGDADAAFGDAPYVRRERLSIHRFSAMPMETRGLLAEWDPGRTKVTLLGVTKAPFLCRRILAKQMDMPEGDIDMVEGDTGGSFGVRGEFYPEDFLIPFAARHVGRPVKWIEDRREHFIATNHARQAECEIEIACTRDGTILALRGLVHTDAGAYVRTNGVTPARNISQVSTGPYRIPHVRIDVALMVTNKTPVGTYRGPGRFETDFFRERLLDIVAEDLGIDRVELRRRNLVPESEMPYPLATCLNSQTECDSGDYRMTLERCLSEFNWSEKTRLNGKLIDGRWHGIGIGCYIEGGASGPREGARLVVESDGRVSVYTGSSANGQGLETVFTQIAADALGIPMERIRGVFHGSTAYVKEGFGAFSSRSVVMGGSAITVVAGKLKEAIRSAAAAHFGCTAAEIAAVEGERALAADGRSISWAELAARSPAGLFAEGSFASSKRTYSYGAHAAHVAVDPGTGRVEVIDYVAVEDVGRIINPETLHGQALGAIVQGLGGVLLEGLVYDEEAQLLTGSFADYLMPTSCDFPNIRVFALEERPSPNNPLGAKGAGEGGIIPVGGVVANAVAAALAPLGVRLRDLPLSPPRVWQLIHEARG